MLESLETAVWTAKTLPGAPCFSAFQQPHVFVHIASKAAVVLFGLVGICFTLHVQVCMRASGREGLGCGKKKKKSSLKVRFVLLDDTELLS